ncbi:MAG: hypothetical protein J0I29_07970 [Rhizobiales bacterium]|nr:hypothetical protein [Hyphomicrobiales bacterium]
MSDDGPNGRDKWNGLWRTLVALDAVLAGACVWWIYAYGLSEALQSSSFAYLGIAAISFFIVISVRGTKRILRDGVAIDRRNYIDMSRGQWLKRRGMPDTKDSDK